MVLLRSPLKTPVRFVRPLRGWLVAVLLHDALLRLVVAFSRPLLLKLQKLGVAVWVRLVLLLVVAQLTPVLREALQPVLLRFIAASLLVVALFPLPLPAARQKDPVERPKRDKPGQEKVLGLQQ